MWDKFDTKTRFIRRISAVSNAFETIDNEMSCFIIFCWNCIRHGRNATYEPGLRPSVQIYPDIFEWATFPSGIKNFPVEKTFQIEFACPHASDGIQINSRKSRPTCCVAILAVRDWTQLCQVIGFENVPGRIHRPLVIRFVADICFPLWRADSKSFQIRCRILGRRVDESRIQKEKVADLKNIQVRVDGG